MAFFLSLESSFSISHPSFRSVPSCSITVPLSSQIRFFLSRFFPLLVLSHYLVPLLSSLHSAPSFVHFSLPSFLFSLLFCLAIPFVPFFALLCLPFLLLQLLHSLSSIPSLLLLFRSSILLNLFSCPIVQDGTSHSLLSALILFPSSLCFFSLFSFQLPPFIFSAFYSVLSVPLLFLLPSFPFLSWIFLSFPFFCFFSSLVHCSFLSFFLPLLTSLLSFFASLVFPPVLLSFPLPIPESILLSFLASSTLCFSV